MAPWLDAPELRQLLNASPVHVHAEPLRHHRAAVVEKARHAHLASAGICAAAATPAATTVFSVDPNPSVPNGTLMAAAAIADNDIWAVGSGNFSTTSGTATLIEHWDGTSWTIIISPDPGTATNALFAVAALGDGTVVAVGDQQNSGFDPTPLILRN
jgi:hypothetical protein